MNRRVLSVQDTYLAWTAYCRQSLPDASGSFNLVPLLAISNRNFNETRRLDWSIPSFGTEY